MQTGKKPYSENGLSLSNQKIYTEDNIELLYNGLLAECGAEKVYAHVGYGDEWGGLEDIEMGRAGNGFRADIAVKVPGALNICFRDNADNWDNNSGENYTFKVLERKSPRKAARVKAVK